MVSEPDGVDLPDLDGVIRTLRTALSRLEPKHLSSTEAMKLVEGFCELERLVAAGRTLVARRVERSGAWRKEGHRTAAHWMSSATGMAVGQAVGVLETARRLEHLPATTEAFCSGELSETKVREVAAAAAAAPDEEKELLQAARTDTVPALRERC